MANSFVLSRTHLVYALCLPLAVLVGYFLAEPFESGTVLLVACVLGMLAVPILMRWHHPLLIFSWNLAVYPAFLPGQPQLWALMAFASLFFGILARATSPNRTFLRAPGVSRPLVILAGVVILTIFQTGGVGFRSFGSEHYGGKNYFYLLMGICGYFALTSERIPARKAPLYVSLFFLSGVTAIIGNIAYLAGPNFSFVYLLFPPNSAIEQARTEMSLDPDMMRLTSFPVTAAGLYSFVLCRNGVRGLFDAGKPWRMLLVGIALTACMLSGFRSSVILLGLVVAVLFWLEGLWHNRWWPVGLTALICFGVLTVAFVNKLPIAAQRSLAFLPLPIDPLARQSAIDSNEWRINMWKRLLPELPDYLFKGKGYALDPNEMYMAQLNAYRTYDSGAVGSALAGDYHNGPLTVYIPFGLLGVVGFGWFLLGGLRLLWANYRYGDPALLNLNRFLLAAFMAKSIFFLAVFGCFYLDLMVLSGLAGLSVSLNGGQLKAVQAKIVERIDEHLAIAETSAVR